MINNSLQRGNFCFMPMALAAVFVILPGCSSFGGPSENTISHSDEAVVLKVEFEKQKAENLCGLCSTIMLMKYWNVPGKPEVEKELARQAESEAGLSGMAIQEYLEGCGFKVNIFKGVLSGGSKLSLLYHIDRRRPVLVLIPAGDKRHYLLVVGYDPVKKRIISADPASGLEAFPYDKFEEQWKACEYFSLLAVPKKAASW